MGSGLTTESEKRRPERQSLGSTPDRTDSSIKGEVTIVELPLGVGNGLLYPVLPLGTQTEPRTGSDQGWG